MEYSGHRKGGMRNMAVKKETEIKANDKEKTTEKQTEEKQKKITRPKDRVFIYVGPSLPNGRLKKHTVLRGSYDEILKHLGDILTSYPEVKKLIYPVSRLGEIREKVEQKGNILNKYYNDVLTKAKESE